MNILTALLVAVTSGILGVLLGGVMSMWSDHRHWRREDDQRWHPERLAAYVTTLDRLTMVFNILESSTEAARARFQPAWRAWQLRRHLQTATPLLREAQEALFKIKLVSNPQAVAAAEECLGVIRNVSDELATWSQATPRAVFDDLLTELDDARHQLVVVARAELDVAEALPPAPAQ